MAIQLLAQQLIEVNDKEIPRGIHLSPDSPHNEPEMQSFDLSFVISLNKLLNE